MLRWITGRWIRMVLTTCSEKQFQLHNPLFEKSYFCLMWSDCGKLLWPWTNTTADQAAGRLEARSCLAISCQAVCPPRSHSALLRREGHHHANTCRGLWCTATSAYLSRFPSLQGTPVPSRVCIATEVGRAGQSEVGTGSKLKNTTFRPVSFS